MGQPRLWRAVGEAVFIFVFGLTCFLAAGSALEFSSRPTQMLLPPLTIASILIGLVRYRRYRNSPDQELPAAKFYLLGLLVSVVCLVVLVFVTRT